ncbi:phage tail sheath family protein [Chengkuizengella sp. SCS-71B]|uniref:phage tail sheath family protein n=1 Tax=Chengkuizengella sp. SCS-71B TaxID=3115290 RepID=UPI0032C24BAE
MAGGTFTTQNKTRPGVYINFVDGGSTLGSAGNRGVVTVALSLSWGESQKILPIYAGENVFDKLGYDITDEKLLLVKEALKRAQTLLLYRLNEGTKATVTVGSLTATAKYGGERGNDLTLVIQTNIDDSAKFDVMTLLDGGEVDTQTVANIEELQNNVWVDFIGSGALTITAGATLTGGEDGSVTNGNYSDYLNAVEVQDFNTIALASKDATLKSVFAAFIRRLRDEGRKTQLVVENYPIADHEGVISVKNGVILAEGTVLDSSESTVWVAAATAGAQINQSLTYEAYDDAIDVDTRYTNAQIEEALKSGEFVFVPSQSRAVVEQDINTFTSYTPEKGKKFSKNRVIRVLDGIANDFKRIFELYYIGKVDNNDDGRGLFKKECIKYLDSLQNINAIQNFNAQQDIEVEQGSDGDSVYVDASVQPVDSIEKIYMKVKVR